jgi:hypothetical protein
MTKIRNWVVEDLAKTYFILNFVMICLYSLSIWQDHVVS